MSTYNWIVIELRFSDVPPEEIFAYFSLINDRVDPLLYHGNVQLRYTERNFKGILDPSVLDIYETYENINRAAKMRFNDTGDSTSITLCRYRDGEPEIEERVHRVNGDEDPVTDWHVPSETVAKADPYFGQVLDPLTEPVRYLKHRYGFYLLSDLQATYNNEDYETCPTFLADEVLAFECQYPEAAYRVLESLSPVRRYPMDALMVDDCLLVRLESGTLEDEIESHLSSILTEGDVSDAAYRYRTGSLSRNLTAMRYEFTDHLTVVDEMETTELGVVDHHYNPYTYEQDPAEHFSKYDYPGVSFDSYYGHPIGGNSPNIDTDRLKD